MPPCPRSRSGEPVADVSESAVAESRRREPGSGHAKAEGSDAALLSLLNVEVLYADVILALKGVSLQIAPGGCVALLGANGAGKSTTLKAISGVIDSDDGRVSGGSIGFDGRAIRGHDTASIVRSGLVHVMEGRRVLPHMTVEQNLIIGGHMFSSAAQMRRALDGVYQAIPRLTDLRTRTAGYLSGGEQQMLVIGRAIMAKPKLMLIDEPSLGLAPRMTEEVFAVLHRLRAQGLALLIVEQNTRVALEIADYGYVMEGGRIVLEGRADELRANEDVREFYLGLDREGGRKSFREVKHYRRRKRWLG
ncbi:MAG: ABC transporter ATP-binding protein [Burkholderiales bacterium]|nr:ABC transporter ATP-binding protein [Burkholderiales bacterium]